MDSAIDSLSDSNFPVLVVEDDKHDVRFLERAWRINRIPNPLFVVPHGEACLQYLRHEGEYGDPGRFPQPGIILMDIRMPVMDGIECLRSIRSDPRLKTLPVIMLTTSKEDRDRLTSYELGCNTFIQKPVDFEGLLTIIQAIQVYWSMAELP